MFDLAQFPQDTKFEPISDIDRCVLFIAHGFDPKKPDRPPNPWSRDAFQVAVWHEDLIQLQKQGLISGVTPINEREWQLRRHVEAGWKWGRKLGVEIEPGSLQTIDWPNLRAAPQEEDSCGWKPYEYPAFEQDGIDSLVTITAAGWDVVTRELAATLELPESLPDLSLTFNLGWRVCGWMLSWNLCPMWTWGQPLSDHSCC